MPVRPAPLEDIIEKLAVPVTTGADAAQTDAELELQRQKLPQEAIEVAEIQREFGISLREYNAAHGLTPVANHPSRVEEVRRRG